MKITHTIATIFLGLFFNFSVMAQIVVMEPGFQIVNTFALPDGLSSSLGAMLFSDDGNTVFMLDSSEGSDSALWSADVTRNGLGHVMEFGAFTQVFAHPSMDTGLEFGPGTETFVFAIESGGIGQRLVNGSLETTAVTGYDDTFGGLGFIPESFTSGGDIVAVSYDDGRLFRHAVAADGDGSFTINGAGTLYADFSTSIGTSILGDIIFITDGPLAGNAMLATFGFTHSVVYFPLGADGLPEGGTLPTPKIFTSVIKDGAFGAWGLAIDPVTNNIWVVDFDETLEIALIQITADDLIFKDGLEEPPE